ncbi:unnamed protein product, partial [Mesorhabditis belari]|uniref:Uncharacterized protein n=1 Tax=Mesorhabditis belari TaxID=2138241 RepID=A0AAF3EI79_9BILA
MTWCWHPHNHPITRAGVREEDYRCCCNVLTIKKGFTIFIILDVICLILSIIGFFLDDDRFRTWAGPLGILGIVMIIIAVLAITTLKPVFMQIYGIVFLVQFVCSVLIAGFIVMIFAFTGFGMTFVRYTNDERERETRVVATWVAIVTMAFFIVYIAVLIWRAVITYRFYQYVRDRQLSIEQEAHPIAYTTVHPTGYHHHVDTTPPTTLPYHHTTVIETK